ncbi:hypothetical protein ACP275_08G257900 [Erythranthe tilingii]
MPLGLGFVRKSELAHSFAENQLAMVGSGSLRQPYLERRSLGGARMTDTKEKQMTELIAQLAALGFGEEKRIGFRRGDDPARFSSASVRSATIGFARFDLVRRGQRNLAQWTRIDEH